MPELPERTVREEEASAFTLFPDDDPTRWHQAITVERRYWQGDGGPFPHPNGEWAVKNGPWCLNRDDEWEYEPIPSSRWLTASLGGLRRGTFETRPNRRKARWSGAIRFRIGSSST